MDEWNARDFSALYHTLLSPLLLGHLLLVPYTYRTISQSRKIHIYIWPWMKYSYLSLTKKVIFFAFISYDYHKSINIWSIHIKERQKSIICMMWIYRVSSLTVKLYGTRSKWPRRRGLRSVWYNATLTIDRQIDR